MNKIAILYGSSGGNTETVAKRVQELFNGEADLYNVDSVKSDEIKDYPYYILGTSTTGVGDLQDDWDSFDFDSLDVSGKTVALFGLGDSSSYGDTYCDAMGIIYDKLTKKGANIIGQVSTDGYSFDESRSVKDGKFVGLALDADNESDQTEERIKKWTESIKSQIL